MKQKISTEVLVNIQKAFQHAGLETSSNETIELVQPLLCLYNCNPDGSVRWVWSAANKHPDFLKLYHGKGFKPWLFTTLVQLIFLFNLQRFVATGSFQLFTNLHMSDWANHRWALFTGTVGPNQKMIMWKQKGNGETVFYKIALTVKAQLNILNEKNALSFIASMPFVKIHYPIIHHSNEHVLALQDIAKGVRKSNDINELPKISLLSWSAPVEYKPIYETSFWSQKKDATNYLNDNRLPKAFLKKMNALVNEINSFQTIALAPSHGDFTPWNIWMKNNKLSMIDWELFSKEAPALTDVFHFIYQSNILIEHNNYAAIRKQIDQLFAQDDWQDFIKFYALDTLLLEKLYLINTLSYYLDIYTQQPNWHVQISWLLQTWNEALTYLIAPTNIRKTVLNDVSFFLHQKPYATLKFLKTSFENVSENSDIDICIFKKDTQELVNCLENHIYVADVVVKKFSHMYQLHIELNDGSLIHIDCIHKIQRKALQFMDCSEIIQAAKMNYAGVQVASLKHDFTYTWLFYWLNSAAIPVRYQEHFSSFSSTELNELDTYISQKSNGIIQSYKEVFVWNNQLKNKIETLLQQQKINQGFNKIIHSTQYFMDVVKRLFPKKGCIITFSGVDGAGKSTVIENVRFMVEKKYRKPVVVLRHRPSVLPILSAWTQGKENAERKAATTLPRQGNNNSYLSSLIRFAYYYADYLFGQLYIQLRYVLRGYIVLYDRYYFDFINDSKRSNIALPKSFTALLYTFLLKPKYNFFLYASADEILIRKKELDAATITTLTTQYLNLFKKLSVKYSSSKYIPVYNKDLATTLSLIEDTALLNKSIKLKINQLRAAAL